MENLRDKDSFGNGLKLRPGLFNEKESAYTDLNDFFEIESAEDKELLKAEVTYMGTDNAYHNFGIFGTNLTFCLLKVEFADFTHTFKDIDFFITELGIAGETMDMVVTPEYVLDHLPENMSSLLTIQLGKLYRERKS